MGVTIHRKKPSQPSGVPVFSLGSPVSVGALKYARQGIKVGDCGVVAFHYPAGGCWDKRPKDDLYKVSFPGFDAFIYFEELVSGT